MRRLAFTESLSCEAGKAKQAILWQSSLAILL